MEDLFDNFCQIQDFDLFKGIYIWNILGKEKF